MLPETSPSISLATIGRRFGARLFDNLLVGLVWLVPMAITGHVDADTFDRSTWLMYTIWGSSIVYEVWLVAATGQTLGKRLLGLQVVDGVTGAVPNLDQSMRRALPVILGAVPVIGILTPVMWAPALWRPRRQGMHDRIANTIVLDVRESHPAA